ncbi:hypothetical protein ACF3DV_19600 [Chlorogloeopsis fritschii PCC 9212]|uniref:hypothetical protein n=1 Tax=Chlorogloeopsis fritschii TaxID=1124 RepID=UPI000312DBBC|nr:hypothetical protein [Chlorogloeopsis fritschii]
MSTVLECIEQNSHETQRLVDLKYEQLEQLISEAIALHKLTGYYRHLIFDF